MSTTMVSVQHLVGAKWKEFKIIKLQNKIFLIRNTHGWVGKMFPQTITIKGQKHSVVFDGFSQHGYNTLYTPKSDSVPEAKDHFVILFYDETTDISHNQTCNNALMQATSWVAQIPIQTLTVTSPGSNYTPGEQLVRDLVEDKLTRKRSY